MSAFLFRSISNDTRAAVEIAYSALIHAGDLARYSGQACKARAKRSSTVRALVTRAIASCVCTPPHLCALSLSLSLSCPPPTAGVREGCGRSFWRCEALLHRGAAAVSRKRLSIQPDCGPCYLCKGLFHRRCVCVRVCGCVCVFVCAPP